MSSVASAQQQSAAAKSVGNASGWYKTCTETEGSKVCNVQFRVRTETGANITTLNMVEITGNNARRIFQIIVPTGRSLPPGIQLAVDGKRATAIPYLYCRPQGCNAEVRLDDGLVGIFKKGGSIEVTTINFQGQENPVPITLKGFTSAFDGPPKEPEEDNRQKTLADQLKKKAEEERAKSEEGSN
jgi:invasion protein IalB